MATYTRAHLQVEYGTTAWGSAAALIKVVNPEAPNYGQTEWQLISPGGLDPLDREPDACHYHLNRIDGGRGRGRTAIDPADPEMMRYACGEWHGTFPTADLEQALGFLVDELTIWEREEDERWRVADLIGQLRRMIDDDIYCDTPRQTRDLRARWAEVKQAVAAVEMVLFRREEREDGEGTRAA